MRLVKYYQGVTSGTYMGRDDGYPETKRVVYNLDVEVDKVAFVKGFGQEKEEVFAQEKPIAIELVRCYWANINSDLEEKHRHIDLAEKRAKYDQLKKELGL